MKKFFKRPFRAISFGALLFSLIFVVSAAFAITASVGYAATSGVVLGLQNDAISLTFSGDGDNPWNASGDTINGSVQSTSGTCSNTHYSSTLTLTNNRSSKATLSFDYEVDLQGGEVKIDGSGVSGSGSFSKELGSNGSTTVYIKSASTSAATKITMKHVSLAADIITKTTFLVSENGTYTVDGIKIIEDTEFSRNALESYSLVATPNEGYVFGGWFCVSSDAQEFISTSQTAELHIEKNCSVKPVFKTQGIALYETDGQIYDDFDKSMDAAKSGKTKLVRLFQNGVLSGSHEIPSGVTFFVPRQENDKVLNENPKIYTPSDAKPSFAPYKILSIDSNSKLSVKGSLYISGAYASGSGGEKGYMAGGYGLVLLNDNSAITVEANGALYVWGFISGGGTVNVKTSGKVYEWFQILDFRGGTATSKIKNGVFPFSQYGVQNVEVPLTIQAGASEIVYTGVYALSKINPATISFIGDDGLFKIVSGSLTKRYDYATDRVEYSVSGEAEVNNLSLNVAGSDVNSKDYVFPITNNMTVKLLSGKLTVNQTLALLAGVEFDIAAGAETVLPSGKKIYAYDRDEWTENAYTCKGKFATIQNVPLAGRYARKESDLTDAKIDICGKLTASGEIYTTKGGANIISSNGVGVFVQEGNPGTETNTYQYTQSNKSVTAHEIPITAAKLKNVDGSYFETAKTKKGTSLQMDDGFWGEKFPDVTVTYHLGLGKSFTFSSNKSHKILNSQDITGDSSTKTAWAWSDDEDFSSDVLYTPGESVSFTKDTDLYPVFSGWVNGHYYFDEGLGRIKGLYFGLAPEGAESKTMWFDSETGKFDPSLEGVKKWQGEFYYLLKGCSEVPANGWYRESSLSEADKVAYYYFGNHPIAYRNTTMYVDTPCKIGTMTYLPKGWYTFSGDGYVEKAMETIDPQKNGQAQIGTINGTDYCLIDGVKAGIGLFESNGYVYYAQKGASLFKNGTLFVPDANGITGNDKKTVLAPGLYAFNEKGQMLDGDYQLIQKS